MTDSHIGYNVKGDAVSFVGPEAVDTYRMAMVLSSIKLHKRSGIIPTRGVTITKLFAMATGYTGKTYKRGEHDRAAAELQVVLDHAKRSVAARRV